MGHQWFPGGRFNPAGWRLDIVSLLAVIGDNSVSIHAQELTSSWLCLLPRLIPAPQALLRSHRPRRLHAPSATITGVYSGINISEINFFANIIHDIDSVHPYEFRQYRISLNRDENPDTHAKEKLDLPESKADSDVEVGAAPFSRSKKSAASTTVGFDNRRQTFDNGVNTSTKGFVQRPMVPPSKTSPMHLLTVFSCAITIGAFVWAACIQDGIALLAIAFISIASSAIGLGLWWRPRLATRPISSPVPGGDVVIRTRGGAFIVVSCEDRVARELYVGSELCEYLVEKTAVFRVLSGTGTLLLMVSVVLLGNCTWTMQAVVGGIYVLLNGLYWSVSILHKRHFWDMSRYHWEDTTDDTLRNAHLELPDGQHPSWTRTLWYAIYVTKSVDWVRNSGATPSTEAWENWVTQAYENRHNPYWEAEKARDRLMAQAALVRPSSVEVAVGTGVQEESGASVDGLTLRTAPSSLLKD